MANNLKVIIAGGGIAGLTLANALEVRFLNAILQHLANLVHSKRTLTMYF
jgi:2-polyprenyl-6-methoxyphenol hydroxylase-like FAD-dependent oxidoreductase